MTENGQLSKSEFLQMVEEGGDVWLRFGVVHQDGQNSLVFLDGISVAELHRREDRTWSYNGLTLFDRVLPGGSIKQFIESGEIVVGDQRITMSEIPDTINQTRRPSLANCRLGKLEWPTTTCTLTFTQPSQLPMGLLIGLDAPSFQSYHAAFAAFFGVDLAPGNRFDQNGCSLRYQDKSGRITKVVWSKTTIDVVVEGDALAGAVIELASPSPGESKVLSEEPLQRLSFSIPDTGLPLGSWLVLRRDGEWMDYKFLNQPYAVAPDSGVEIVVEKQDEVQSLITQGEGPTIEFKEDVPTQKSTRLRVCKTVAAFSNGKGGTILFGVRDDGSIKGITSDLTKRELCDSITNWVKAIVAPLPDFDVRVVNIPDNETEGSSEMRPIVIVTVNKGPLPPYCVDPKQPQYYIRRGATTSPAPPEQLRSVVQLSLPVPTVPLLY